MAVSSVVAVDAVAEFRTRVRGDILEMADAGYDDARKIWNGMIDKRPAVIARCAGVADVIEAVQLRTYEQPAAGDTWRQP